MRRRATKGQILGSLGLLAAVIAAGVWWWPHIVWSFQIGRHGVKVQPVKVAEMKAPGKSADWSTCRLGPLSFKLPAQFVDEAERSIEQSNVVLATPELTISINVPYKVPENALTELAGQLHDTPIRLVADSYRTGTDDFRWTMSRHALNRHMILINLAGLFPHGAGQGATSVETRYDKDIEGLLIVYDNQHTGFDWRTTSDAGAGVMVFTQKQGKLDLDFARDVAQSVSCDESRLGPAYSKKELQQVLDAMETKRAP